MAVLLWLDPDQRNYRSATERQLIGTVEAGHLSGSVRLVGPGSRDHFATLRTEWGLQ
jgi:hypothetical protein